MVIFKRSLPSKRCVPHESTSLWHVQTTQDHSHTPRYTRDMISYPLFFFRLIDRGRKSASGSASRLPAAVAAAPIALGMAPEHQLSGLGPLGAARELPGAPNGRHRAHRCQARLGAIFEGLQKSTKSARRAAGEATAGGGDCRGDVRGAGGGCGAVGGGAGAVGGTCRAHTGAVSAPAGVARRRLRLERAWKMGIGGRRRTKIDAGEVVSTLGCRPQTQTPLREPWLHHNHGLGRPPECWSCDRQPAPMGEVGGGRWALAWAAGQVRGVGGSIGMLKASSRRPPTTPRRQSQHLLGRCRTSRDAADFGGPGRERDRSPH
jgi:hypothetical protein